MRLYALCYKYFQLVSSNLGEYTLYSNQNINFQLEFYHFSAKFWTAAQDLCDLLRSVRYRSSTVYYNSSNQVSLNFLNKLTYCLFTMRTLKITQNQKLYVLGWCEWVGVCAGGGRVDVDRGEHCTLHCYLQQIANVHVNLKGRAKFSLVWLYIH